MKLFSWIFLKEFLDKYKIINSLDEWCMCCSHCWKLLPCWWNAAAVGDDTGMLTSDLWIMNHGGGKGVWSRLVLVVSSSNICKVLQSEGCNLRTWAVISYTQVHNEKYTQHSITTRTFTYARVGLRSDSICLKVCCKDQLP